MALEAGWTPITVVAARLIIGLPILWLTTPRGWSARATRADAWRLGLISTAGLALPHLVGAYGLATADSQQGAILSGMEPVVIVLLAHLFLGEVLGGRQLVGIAIGLAGALLVVSGGDARALWAAEGTTRGTLLLALHCALWAIYTVAGKPTLERVPPTALAAVTTTVASVLVLPFALLEAPALDPTRALAPAPLFCVAMLGVGASWLGTVLWVEALRRISATLMAALVFVQPVTGLVLGALIGEQLTAVALAGAVVVFVGVWFVAPRAETGPPGPG